MTKRIPSIILLIASGVIIGVCTILGKQNVPSKCDPQLQTLLLTADDFPTGWTRGEPIQDDEFREGAIDSCLVSYYVLNGVAGQIVNIYRDEAQAVRGYSNLISYLAWQENAQPLATPHYVSSAADEYFLECAIPVDTPMCQFIGRYEHYVTRFNTHFRPKFMTEEELVRVLQAIDNRLSASSNNTSVSPMR